MMPSLIAVPAGRRAVAAAALAAAAACAPYRPDPRLAADPARVVPGTDIRVTRVDGTRVELRQAAPVGDSLVGFSGAPPGRRTAVARADVRAVERRRLDGRATLDGYGLYVGLVALVASIPLIFNP